MKKCNSGITRIGVLIVCIIIISSISLFVLTAQGTSRQSQIIRCRANLDRIKKSTTVYLFDIGQNVLYPPWKNPDFFATLYKAGLVESKCFICPASGNKPASKERIYSNDPNITDYECRTTTERMKPRGEIQAGIWEKQSYHGDKRAVLTAFGPCQGILQFDTAKILTQSEFVKMRQKDKEDIIHRQLRKEKLTIKEINTYANHSDTRMRAIIASSTSTPTKTLIELSHDQSEFVRRKIAANLSTPKEILLQLAHDKKDAVRNATAINPNTPLPALKILAKDSIFSVRYIALKKLQAQ